MESLPRLILSLMTWIGCADSHASNRQLVFGLGETRACFSNEGGAISYDRTLNCSYGWWCRTFMSGASNPTRNDRLAERIGLEVSVLRSRSGFVRVRTSVPHWGLMTILSPRLGTHVMIRQLECNGD